MNDTPTLMINQLYKDIKFHNNLNFNQINECKNAVILKHKNTLVVHEQGGFFENMQRKLYFNLSRD